MKIYHPTGEYLTDLKRLLLKRISILFVMEKWFARKKEFNMEVFSWENQNKDKL
jgi:hypothetical protein